jgi:hypothetical protein
LTCSVANEGTNRSLTIVKAALEDAAEYVCTLDKLKVKTILEVEIPHIPPTVPSEFVSADFYVKKGEDAVVDIPFAAYPVPQAVWTFKGKGIKKTKKFTPTVTETSARFIIKQTDEADTGLYACKLTNECGDTTAQVTVRLLGKQVNFIMPLALDSIRFPLSEKPSSPSAPECLESTDDSITLLWKPPGFNGGATITNYVIEYQEKAAKK